MTTEQIPSELERTCKVCNQRIAMRRLDMKGKYWQCPHCKQMYEGYEINFRHYNYQ